MAGKADFIKSVLGAQGAEALAKAVERQPELESVLFPRTIMAWLNLVAPRGFNGVVPGSACGVEFSKNEGAVEALDAYEGKIEVKGHTYNFKNASVYHLAALIASAMGEEKVEETPAKLKDAEIARLGKSLDMIVIARASAAAYHYEEFRKSTQGLFAQAAFRHRPTNKVVPTGPRHDIEMIDPDAYDRGEYEDGFITHENKFVNREQAHRILHAGQQPEHHWDSVQSEDLFEPANKGEVIQMPGTKHDPTKEMPRPNTGRVGQAREAKPKVVPGLHLDYGGTGAKVKKAELPGKPAAPKAPTAPTAPTAATGPKMGVGKPQAPKAALPVAPGGKPAVGAVGAVGAQGAKPGVKTAPKLPGIKIAKAEADNRCATCGHAQFKGPKFTGCSCFVDMAKSVKTEARPDGFLLTFGREWDSESIKALLNTIRGE